MNTIRLQSSDLEVFELDIEFARHSGWMRSVLEDSRNFEEQDLIPLTNLNGEVLRKVIEWMVYYKGDITADEEEMNRRQQGKSDDFSKWNKEFFDVDKEMLIELVLAANFLDIRGLLKESCRAVEDLIVNRSPKNIRQLFNRPALSSASTDEQSGSSCTTVVSNREEQIRVTSDQSQEHSEPY